LISHMDDAEDFVAIDGTSIREVVGLASLHSGRQSLSEVIVPCGIATVEHIHRTSQEVYFVQSGRGRVRVGEERVEVRAGNCVVIPPESIHNLTNTGTEPLRVICVCAPPYRDEDTVVISHNPPNGK